ncbi:MAG: metallophosphatase family protein [Verrucomicrobiales bacterium]|nr:metallophosphatase family protein [Verrucomicrobiales bacterium]|tara:strand:- start:349 stop:1071 length:723 start_codon:yes stop_codon:yes gene_type:complete
MKYAIISDIHGNLEALETVLTHAKEHGCEKYVCGGDVVGYNANPSECMAIVREMNMPCVMGNHDEYVGNDIDLSSFNPVAAEAVLWTRSQLSEEERKWLRDLRYIRLVDSFSVVHATMDGPKYWGYVQSKMDAAASFTYQTTPVCFHGHTHVPLAFTEDLDISGGAYESVKVERNKRYFINVGSVGQPRDGDPRAAYVIYDTDAQTIQLFRLNYDLEKAQEKIRAAGLPDRLADRLGLGK